MNDLTILNRPKPFMLLPECFADTSGDTVDCVEPCLPCASVSVETAFSRPVLRSRMWTASGFSRHRQVMWSSPRRVPLEGSLLGLGFLQRDLEGLGFSGLGFGSFEGFFGVPLRGSSNP